jgi:hypothetical protein
MGWRGDGEVASEHAISTTLLLLCRRSHKELVEGGGRGEGCRCVAVCISSACLSCPETIRGSEERLGRVAVKITGRLGVFLPYLRFCTSTAAYLTYYSTGRS